MAAGARHPAQKGLNSARLERGQYLYTYSSRRRPTARIGTSSPICRARRLAGISPSISPVKDPEKVWVVVCASGHHGEDSGFWRPLMALTSRLRGANRQYNGHI